ncbi:hypothetical protein DL89DRAFT_107975 [Linderina pennispora]|uniref:Uncharacterized protein n=1 Tax=Linderina pennispora TaxID=61395 RepID=A0A1Y1WG28_9FUNG|nr:uncharacterized protein DL89DRAFT_107975 [Linderina pennispora]ORX72094.1 hypothetical protein DL89DRAFT_107975 [Linderina pennispora]
MSLYLHVKEPLDMVTKIATSIWRVCAVSLIWPLAAGVVSVHAVVGCRKRRRWLYTCGVSPHPAWFNLVRSCWAACVLVACVRGVSLRGPQGYKNVFASLLWRASHEPARKANDARAQIMISSDQWDKTSPYL